MWSLEKGVQWDIINGYMGGEKTKKPLNYERIIAQMKDARTLPFEAKKK